MSSKKVAIAAFMGGLLANLTEYLIHAVLMHDVYTEYAAKGIMAQESKPIEWIHYPLNFLVAIPVVVLYVISRSYYSNPNKALLATTLCTGTLYLGLTSALYAFYNLGTTIPVVISLDKLLECLLAALCARIVIR